MIYVLEIYYQDVLMASISLRVFVHSTMHTYDEYQKGMEAIAQS